METAKSEITKVSHTLDSELMKAVEQEATKDHRSRSNMIEVLLREALEARSLVQDRAEQSETPASVVGDQIT